LVRLKLYRIEKETWTSKFLITYYKTIKTLFAVRFRSTSWLQLLGYKQKLQKGNQLIQ
jgi:hypothetical protein